jgi:hypothetical protein
MHYIPLLPILPILDGISKCESIHGIVILSKYPKNQIKMIFQPIFKLRFHKRQGWEAPLVIHTLQYHHCRNFHQFEIL